MRFSCVHSETSVLVMSNVRCFAVAVFKGPRGTDLLPGTSESARSHEPAGGAEDVSRWS